MSLVMGIDLGTSSTKTIVLDQSGSPVAAAASSYAMSTPHPGWVEQAPDDWWTAVCATIRNAVAELPSPHTPSDIKGVALSGQMNGAVAVTSSGKPIRPAILWLDSRSQQECDAANGRAGDLLRDQALAILNPVNTLAKILWLRDHEPDTYAETAFCMIPKDWVRFRLTGQVSSEVSDASVSAAMDIYNRNWSGDILDSLDLPSSLFPDVLESTDVAGAVTDAAARETGLPVGTPVCAGGGDMACMAVGSGAIRPGVVGVGIGTAGHAITYAETISSAAFNQLWPMCHCVPNAYFWLGCSFTGGASLTWLSDQLGEDFETLTSLAGRAPAGSEELYFMPWLAGTGTPNPDARLRGGWAGLSLQHDRTHLARSVLEGVAFDLRQALDCFRSLDLSVDDLRLGEGGARSPLWRQIMADVFGIEARLMDLADASAIGAAIVAGVGVGVYESFDEACRRTLTFSDRVVPNPKDMAAYDACYERFTSLYPTMKPWYHGPRV